jgi:hypothetical protein
MPPIFTINILVVAFIAKKFFFVCSKNIAMIKLHLLASIKMGFRPLLFISLVCCGSANTLYGQGGLNWKVWVKTSPCSGRHDWISVAKENPTTSGLNYYVVANVLFPLTPCTSSGCSFSDATKVANSLKFNDAFSNYCCRDYSVWEQSGTGKKTIVVGKFGTAGVGWFLVRGDLCCEEAETLAGIPNGCSGRSQVQCWPGSYSAWNPQTQKTECFCNPGLVWNSTKTACVPSAVDCSKSYANSEARWDASTNQYLCYCKQGYEWNSTRTACVLSVPDCNKSYKNSIAVWDAASQKYLCNCPQGYVWNQARTECVLAIPDCNSYYKNSVAVWDAASQKYLCNCPQGYQWNANRTECVTIQNQLPDCNATYRNSEARWDASTNQYLCYCKQGYDWNATRTECVPVTNRDNPYVAPEQKKTGVCNIQYKSGANEPEQYTIDVQKKYGSLTFTYNTYTVKDRIHIYYNGSKVFDSGCVGSSGSQVLTLNGYSSVFTIIVDPRCDKDQSNTAWDFTMGCPN